MDEMQEILVGNGLSTDASENMTEQELLKSLDELTLAIYSSIDTNRERFNALAKRALDLFVFGQNGTILSKLEKVATAIGMQQFRLVLDYILGKGIIRYVKKDGSYSLPTQRVDKAKFNLSQFRKEHLSFLDAEKVAINFFKNEKATSAEKDFKQSLELLKKYAKKNFKAHNKFLEKLELFLLTYQDNDEDEDLIYK